jgi:hypothetical protein
VVAPSESGKRDIERRKWLNAMCHIEGGVAGGLADSSAVSQKIKVREYSIGPLIRTDPSVGHLEYLTQFCLVPSEILHMPSNTCP